MMGDYQIFDRTDASIILAKIVKDWPSFLLPDIGKGKLSYRVLPARRFGLNSFVAIMILCENESIAVVKFPRYKDGVLGRKALGIESQNIKYLSAFADIGRYAPKMYFSGKIEGVPVIIEKAYEGKMLHECLDAEEDSGKLESLLQEGSEIILNIHASSKKAGKCAGADFFRNYIDFPLKKICQYYPERIIQVEKLIDSMSRKDFLDYPTVFMHGDMNPWNILCSNDGEKIVFDLEDSDRSGLPFMDVFNYFVVCFRILFVGETQASKNRPLEIRKKRALLVLGAYTAFIKKYCNLLDIDESLADLFFVVFAINMSSVFINEKRLEINYGASWLGLLFNVQNAPSFEAHVKSIING